MAISTKNLTLPRQVIEEDGLVIFPLREYEKMSKKMARLIEEKKVLTEEARVLEIIAEGEREYKGGKTIKAPSLKQALKIYQSKK